MNASLALAYSAGLKRIPVFDAFTLATLFTLRLALGIVASSAPPSQWLLVFSMFLFGSSSFAKRNRSSLLTRMQTRLPVSGCLAAGLNWAVRFPLNALMSFPAAVLCAATIGMGAGFLLYRSFVFPPSQRAWHLQMRDFILVSAAGAAITTLVTVMLRDLLSSAAQLD